MRPDLHAAAAAAAAQQQAGGGKGGKGAQADLKHEARAHALARVPCGAPAARVCGPLPACAPAVSKGLHAPGSVPTQCPPLPRSRQVALLIEGRADGLTAAAAAVAVAISAARGAPAGGDGRVAPLLARNVIQEVAVRKSYGLKDGEARGAAVAAARAHALCTQTTGPRA